MEKSLKFTPELTKLIIEGFKTTTWRLFDDKNLLVGDILILATRDKSQVSNFAKAIIKDIKIRTLSTLQPEDYEGHEPSPNPLADYNKYYGDKVQSDSEVIVIKFKILEFL